MKHCTLSTFFSTLDCCQYGNIIIFRATVGIIFGMFIKNILQSLNHLKYELLFEIFLIL